MSENNTPSRPERHEAVRLFATELNESKSQFQDQSDLEQYNDEDRAPNYNLLPTGAKANRVLMMGAVTDITLVNEEYDTHRAKIIDRTGEFYVYAGQYNDGPLEVLKDLANSVSEGQPEHVMIVGKPNSYTTDNGTTNVSIDPETVVTASAADRDRWASRTAEHTLQRLDNLENGATEALNGSKLGELANQIYDFDVSILRSDVKNVIDDLESSKEVQMTTTAASA